MKKIIQKTLFASIIGFGAITSSLAGTTTGNFQSTAALLSSCTIYANDIGLGTLTPALGAGFNGSGLSMGWNCSKSVAYTISLIGGNSGDQLNRQLVSADAGNTDKLNYQVYIGNMPDTTKPWGDSMGGTSVITGVGNGTVQGVQIWGKLPVNQFVRPGTYSDTLTVQLDY